jgi:hypothetical protein
MKAASLLIAAGALAIMACGFIKMSQNTFVDPVAVQYANEVKPKVNQQSLGAGLGMSLGATPSYQNAIGAKALIQAWLKVNTPSVDSAALNFFNTETKFGTKQESNRNLKLKRDTLEKAIPTLLKLSAPVQPTVDETNEIINEIKACTNGGFVKVWEKSSNDFVNKEGFSISLHILAIDCKGDGNVDTLSFSRSKGGSFNPATLERKVLVCKDEGFFSGVSCSLETRSIKIPREVDDEAIAKTFKGAQVHLYKELDAYTK